MKFYEKYYPSNYEELITYYPRYYGDVFEMVEILKAYGRIIDGIEENIEQAYLNGFIDYADEAAIEKLEGFLKIGLNRNRTLEERRRLVKSYFVGFGKISATVLNRIVLTYFRTTAEISLKQCDESGNHGLFIIINKDAEEVLYTSDFTKILRLRIPAHIKWQVNARIISQVDNTKLNQLRLVYIKFYMYIPFWGDDIYTGPYCYDGTLTYNAVRKYKLGLLIRYLMHTQTQQYVSYRQSRIKAFIQEREYTDLSLRSFYSISFWGCSVYNGQAYYDGTLLYNSVRNYKVCIIVRNYIGIFTLQRIVCNRNCTKVLIQNRMQTDVLLYFLYRIKQRESILKVATQYLIKLNVVEEINHNSEILSMQVLHKNILNIWHRYKGKVKNNKPKVVDKVKIQMNINSPCGHIGNMQIITQRNVAYYDGTLRYDGTARYDALYKEERVE